MFFRRLHNKIDIYNCNIRPDVVSADDNAHLILFKTENLWF